MIRALRRIVFLALASLGGIVLLMMLLPLQWYVSTLAGPVRDPRGGVLIVLGAESYDGPAIGEGSFWRSVYAARAWREGSFQHLILSGDSSITVPMRDFLICQGVPVEAVVIEGRSTSTRENALFASEIARQFSGPYVLLTSDYHMWRARRAFLRVGLSVETRPVPDAGKRLNHWRQRWPIALDLAVESGKIAYYRLRGWI